MNQNEQRGVEPKSQAELENVAQTVLRSMPVPISLRQVGPESLVEHIAVPKGYEVKVVDNEAMLPRPRALKATADFSDLDSFLAYVKRNAGAHSIVWGNFDPTTYALDFTAVFDEHAGATAADQERPGWRRHRATFKPALSKEWGIWTKHNGHGAAKGQLAFAEFLEDNSDDIASGEGLPSSLEMLDMARTFEVNADKRFRSAIRVQSGGQALEYVDTDDAGTVARMQFFERFQIGIPVFRGEKDGVLVLAKLRYRINQGAVSFWYELRRPDKAHQMAAEDLIKRVRAAIGDTPLMLGSIAG